jgi:hypothetical protein
MGSPVEYTSAAKFSSPTVVRISKNLFICNAGLNILYWHCLANIAYGYPNHVDEILKSKVNIPGLVKTEFFFTSKQDFLHTVMDPKIPSQTTSKYKNVKKLTQMINFDESDNWNLIKMITN